MTGPDTFETLTVAVDGPTATLWLDRPDKLNPLSTTTLLELERAARWLDDQPGLKVVVVGGRGRAFSAGADLSTFSGRAAGSSDRDGAPSVDPLIERDAGWRMGRAFEELRAVTVARIQGWCVGGGVVLAAACDLRVASSDARFSIPEIDLGIPLAWGGIPRLVREIGPARTKELVMTGRRFDADEAERLGFVNRVVAEERLDVEIAELVEQLAAKSRYALLATKVHTNAVTEAMVSTGRSWGDADNLVAGLHDAEGAEIRRRYLDRRP